MKKRKRLRKITVYCSIEGKTEGFLLEYLKEIYSDMERMSFDNKPTEGGSPDTIVDKAIKAQDRKISFAWFDEDKELSPEARQRLANCWHLDDKNSVEILSSPLSQLQKKFNGKNRNPILIVSYPICIESLILKILGRKLPYETYDHSIREKQIRDLKNTISGIFQNKNHFEYYKTHLDKDILDLRRKEIPELDLLLK